MSKLLEAAMVEKGWDQSPRNTAAGRRAAELVGVTAGPEFLRIRSLRRRRWQDAADLDQLVELLSRKLKVANPAQPNARLFPVQAACLREAFDEGDLYGCAEIGSGKTLILFLLPVIEQKQRPLLLVPAKLVEKSKREFAEMARTWKSAPRWEFLAYEKLSRSDKLLYEYNPDILLADESHCLGSPKSGRTRKLLRFRDTHPECAFRPVTATPGDKGLGQYSHLMHAAVGPARAPVPATGSYESVQWQQCLDMDVLQRRSPGCLALFAPKAVTLDDIRAGVGERIEQSPGVIFHRVSEVTCALYMDAVVHDGPSDVIEFVRESWDVLPSGRVLETPVERAQLWATLGLGFARTFETPPPDDWRAARKLWTAFANEVLKQDIPGIDTPGAVALACSNGTIDSGRVFEEWSAIKPSFKPVTIAEWFDTAALERIAKWADENDALIATAYPELGRKLSALTGRSFYHEMGLDASGRAIEDHPDERSVIMSIGSCGTGRNLQKWNKMLVIGAGSSSDRLSQLAGRVHRTGQRAEQVEVSFFVSCLEDLRSLYKARARAEYDRRMGRNQASKILACDWLVPALEDARKWKGARWES